ncbi:MAG: trypsin-like serine peptidase [Planctomycetota bacterium]|jgi:V8-like Glu-specific endopeptidase
MRLLLPSLIVLAFLAQPLYGQQTPDAPLDQVVLEYVVDSGIQANVAGDPATMFATTIEVEGAQWLRIYFGKVVLAEGSSVRMTSLHDNQVQELDAYGMAMWGNTSAYFNGDAVHVELIAAPGTTGNRLRIEELAHATLNPPAALGGPGDCGICGSDDRVPSTERWTARLWPAGCTATVIGEDSCMVSAGHCVSGNMVVQFNVPNSTPGCNPVSPPVADQFPIVDYTFENNGPGDDWSVLKAGTNNLLQTPYDRYGVFRPISFQPGHANDTVEVTGYGADDTCILTFTQQYGIGFICQTFSNAYTFAVDIRGGNSGSALMRNDEIIGVVTHCPCCNVATRVTNSDFAAAIAELCIPPESQTTTLPFFDDFEEVILRPEFWTGVDGADVWVSGINEPSGQISMRLDATNPEGGGDEARSAIMDTTGIDGLKLTYWYEQTGEEDSPEADDDLLVEYLNASEVWVELNRHLGSGPDMTDYEFVSIVLPDAAKHAGFRLRFNALSDESGELDTHFVDDVCIGTEGDCPEPSACPWDCGDPADGEVSVVDFLAMLAQWGQVDVPCDVNGGGVDVTDFLEMLAAWGPCP